MALLFSVRDCTTRAHMPPQFSYLHIREWVSKCEFACTWAGWLHCAFLRKRQHNGQLPDPPPSSHLIYTAYCLQTRARTTYSSTCFYALKVRVRFILFNSETVWKIAWETRYKTKRIARYFCRHNIVYLVIWSESYNTCHEIGRISTDSLTGRVHSSSTVTTRIHQCSSSACLIAK